MAESRKKIVVITGCSSGIGLESAVLLAKEKDCKVIATMRNLKKKEALEKATGENLNRSLVIKELDISKEESILKFVKEIIASEGRIDVLINNAAFGQSESFENITLEQMQTLFQTNFFGTVRITQEVIRKMKGQRSGKVIFVSSIGGIAPFMFSEFYVASKFAIEGLVGCLAPVMRMFNISITSVQPGPVQTAFVANVSENNMGSMTGSGTDDSETNVLREKFMKNIRTGLTEAMQTGEQVAQVIKKCVQDEKPDVRVATSEYVKKRGEAILVDYSGNATADAMEALLK